MRTFDDFSQASKLYESNLKLPKKNITAATKKAISRFLNPNYKTKPEQPIIKITLNSLKRTIPQSLTKAQFELVEKILERAEKNQTHVFKVYDEIRLAFNFTRPKSNFNFEMFLYPDLKLKTMRSIACAVAPMFFTKFPNPESVTEFIENETTVDINELFVVYTRYKRAQLRTKKEGAVRDLAWFLTYGLLPNEKRTIDIKVRPKDQKMIHDLCDEVYSNYKKFLKIV